MDSNELLVILAGLKMFGRPGLGPFSIVENGLDGWDDGVSMRGEKIDRPQAHGSFNLPRYQGSRTVTLTGLIEAANAKEREVSGLLISGLLAGGGTDRIQVTKGGLTTWADCSLDIASVDPRRGSVKSDFQLVLWCADPLRYGETNTETIPSGSEYKTLTHRGNTVGYPTITVSGSMPGGYALQSSAGAEYRVTTPLVSGNPHTIDMTTGLLQIGGSVVAGGVARADLWRIAGGSIATDMRLQPITTGSGTATVNLLNTYI